MASNDGDLVAESQQLEIALGLRPGANQEQVEEQSEQGIDGCEDHERGTWRWYPPLFKPDVVARRSRDAASKARQRAARPGGRVLLAGASWTEFSRRTPGRSGNRGTLPERPGGVRAGDRTNCSSRLAPNRGVGSCVLRLATRHSRRFRGRGFGAPRSTHDRDSRSEALLGRQACPYPGNRPCPLSAFTVDGKLET
jgi:hypothetical protein